MGSRNDSNSRAGWPRVEVTDRDGERVRCVQRDAVAGPREKREDHRADLGLLGLSIAHERFLDERACDSFTVEETFFAEKTVSTETACGRSSPSRMARCSKRK